MTVADTAYRSPESAQLGLTLAPNHRPQRHMSDALVCAFLLPFDFCTVVGSGLLAFALHVDTNITTLNVLVYCALTFAAAIVMLTFGSLNSIYDEAAPKHGHIKLARALATWSCTLLVILGGVFFMQAASYVSRGWVGYWFVLGAFGLCVTRFGFRSRITRWRTRGFMRERVVIVGKSETVTRLTSYLERPELEDAYEILGAFDVDGTAGPSYGAPGALRTLGPAGTVLDFVRTHQVEMVIVSTGPETASAIASLCTQLSETPVKVHLCPDQHDFRLPVIKVDLIGGVSLLQVNCPTLSEPARILKALEDRLLATIMLMIALPLMAVAALAIRLDSPGPILFRQTRFGFNNRPISVLKFRSMYADRGDASGAQRTILGDPRVTRVGRFLRRTSIDELPQLLNVLRGEMSLVGPRAHPLHMKVLDQLYHEAIPGYSSRHRVKPGLTGLAQINGCRGEIDSVEKAAARLSYDLDYVSRWSLLLDLKILVQTPFRAFKKVY